MSKICFTALSLFVFALCGCGEGQERVGNFKTAGKTEDEQSKLSVDSTVESLQVAGEEWIVVKQYHGKADIYVEERKPNPTGAAVVVRSKDPVITVKGQPKVKIEKSNTIVLTWSDGRTERHDYGELRLNRKPVMVKDALEKINLQINLKEVIDELNSVKPPGASNENSR